MGMQGFDNDDSSAPMAEINTTPLVDVMLVMLVLFLVTAPMVTQAIKLELPNEVATETADKDPISISISEQGSYYWGDDAVNELELETRLKAAKLRDKEQPIHLHADKNVAYGKVSKVLSLSQKHGLSNIGFVTEKK